MTERPPGKARQALLARLCKARQGKASHLSAGHEGGTPSPFKHIIPLEDSRGDTFGVGRVFDGSETQQGMWRSRDALRGPSSGSPGGAVFLHSIGYLEGIRVGGVLQHCDW